MLPAEVRASTSSLIAGRRGAATCSRCARGRSGRARASAPVLPRAGRVDPVEGVLRQQTLREVDRRVPRADASRRRGARASGPRSGVTGRPYHGSGTGRGGIWCASAITSTAPRSARASSAWPLRESTIFVTLRHGRVRPRRERARPQRVAVDAAAVLGEVHVQPRRLDVPEQLVPLRDALVVLDGRDDVPVAEVDVAVRRPTSDRVPSRCTTPPRTAYTGVPFGAEMSIPKWNARDVPEMRGSLK